MDDAASLRQTVTHLFDAVRYSRHAQELEEAAQSAEANLEADLNILESQSEEVTNLLSTMRQGAKKPLVELSKQVTEFLYTAKDQARAKLEKTAREEAAESLSAASIERDRAIKSMEAYLASDPLPVVDHTIAVRFVDGTYHAQASYECDGGMKYSFGLAAQNSRLFHEEFMLSQLGHEVRVPVRFSRSLLKKSRVPGFERLDQYLLADAEATQGRIRANFQKMENSARIKVITSGSDSQGFVGLEYADGAREVNVMNDQSLSAHVDIEEVRAAMKKVVDELSDLAKQKVTLLRISTNGEQNLKALDSYKILTVAMKVLGERYRDLVKTLPEGRKTGIPNGDLSLTFIRDRLKVLGDLGGQIGQQLGVQPAP
jgi:hypothetical protein